MEQVLLSRIQTLLGTRNRVKVADIGADPGTGTGVDSAGTKPEAGLQVSNGAIGANAAGTGKTDTPQLEVMSFEFDDATLARIEQVVARAKQQLAQVRVSEISHSYQDLLRAGSVPPPNSEDQEQRSADWHYHDLATSLDELADLLLEHNYFAVAISAYQRALDLRTSAVIAGPASPLFSEAVDWRVERAASHFKIAKALKKSGQHEAAAAAQIKGQQTIDETSQPDQDAVALETFADQLEETALNAIDAGDDAGAARCLSESLDLRLRAARTEQDDPYFAKRFIESATEYSESLVGSDWRAKAQALADQCASAGTPIIGADHILARAAVMGE